MLLGADYSHFQRFQFDDGEPSYLRDEYGIEFESGFNVGLVMREDFAFVDSKESPGVQIADLLASGLRRCLRAKFGDNDAVASALGSLMVQAEKPHPPLNLISLADESRASPEAARAVRLMIRACRPMLVRSSRRIV